MPTTFTTCSFVPARMTRKRPRYVVVPSWSGAAPDLNVSGETSGCPFTVSAFVSTSFPAGSASAVPAASMTRQGPAEASVTRGFSSASSTRTFAPGALPIVVPE